MTNKVKDTNQSKPKRFFKRLGKEFLICLIFLIVLGMVANFFNKREIQHARDGMTKQELKMFDDSKLPKNSL